MHARARAGTLTTIGAIAGIALALGAAALPASAGKPVKPGTEFATVSAPTCGDMHEVIVKDVTYLQKTVTMSAGQTLRLEVNPARDGEIISARATLGTTVLFLHESLAVDGYDFTAAKTGTYYLGWQLMAPGSQAEPVDWKFICSTGGAGGGGSVVIADSDGDGVADTADRCAGTVLPDSVRPAAGYYAANSKGDFVDGVGKTLGLSVQSTAGCSAKQIAAKLGLNKRESRSGVSEANLNRFIASL